MKKLLLSIMAACSVASVSAQKGSILYFGSLAGNNSSSDNPAVDKTASAFAIRQGVGYQFSKHITVGLQGGYAQSKAGQNSHVGTPDKMTKNSAWMVGPFGRYTAYLGDRLFVYVQADVVFNAAKTQTPKATAHGRSWGGDLFPAVGLNLYKGWAINLNIGGVSYRYSHPGKTVNNNFAYNIGQTFTFGVSKNFGGCKPVAAVKG
jgi:hypothetical protein